MDGTLLAQRAGERMILTERRACWAQIYGARRVGVSKGTREVIIIFVAGKVVHYSPTEVRVRNYHVTLICDLNPPDL